ncbi:MFS transporter [Bacillus sp. JJ1533]|uniref:MFS transporter n=1 Tax=Bacillus sp. JJ1533 TaxID=3122959 RepID=UPI002FFE58C5
MNLKQFIRRYLVTIMTVFFMLGVMGTRPLVSLLSHELGASPVEIGIITGIFSLLPFFLAIQIGKYIDKHGYKVIILVSSLFSFIGLLLPMVITNIFGIYISQVITGVAYTTFVVAGQTMTGINANDKNRDINVMRFSIGMALGSFLGPFIGGLISEEWGYQNAFLGLGLGCLFALFLALLLVEIKGDKAQESKKQKITNTIGLLKDSTLRKVFLIGVLILFGKDMYAAFFPLLGLEFGLSNSMIGIIISINALAGIIIRWSLPFLLNNFSRTKIIVGSIFLSGICIIILPFFTNWVVLTVLSFTLGMGLGIGQPLSISATIQYLPKERVGEGLGLRLSANRLTQLIAPVIVGSIAEVVSIKGVFYFVGVVLCFGTTKMKGLNANRKREEKVG